MARVLSDEARDGNLEGRALTLAGGADGPIPCRSAHGNQAAFAIASQGLSAVTDAFLFDCAGIARARPRIPGLRRPFLSWLHGIEVWEGARADHLGALRAARVLLANSHHTLERARDLHAGFEHARVCWLGTEEDTVPAVVDRERPPTVMILGRMDAREAYKGHRELIGAWPRIVQAVPNARLVIAGEGSDGPALQQLAETSGAAAHIEFTGFVPDDAIDAVWSRATAFAMPSRGEGFGLTYVEAMRRGLPVVASIHDAAQEINLEGETGFNVSLDEPGALTDRLVVLLRDQDLAHKLGAAGRARWRAHFRYSAFRERFRPHLARLVA